MRDSFFADDDMSPRTLAEACPDLCPPFQSNPPICKGDMNFKIYGVESIIVSKM